MPRPRVKSLYNTERQTVLGVYYIDGRRKRIKIATFEELGLSPTGKARNKSEKGRIASEIERRYWAL